MLKYYLKKNSLVNFFLDYNSCNGSNITNYKEVKEKKDLFNLTIRPRLNSSSLTFEMTTNSLLNTDFGEKLGFGLGIEAEFILPFNKNKLAIIIEPTLQGFKSDLTKSTNSITGGMLRANVEYQSIEFPIGFRHYFFINDKSKFFVNASYVLDIPLKMLTEFKRENNTVILSFDNKEPQSNLAFGVGYKFNDKISLELRHQTSREIIDPNRSLISSDYKTLSIIFGYSIF